MPGIGQFEHGLPTVKRASRTGDEAITLELCEGPCQRLWLLVLCSRNLSRRARSVPVQVGEDAGLVSAEYFARTCCSESAGQAGDAQTYLRCGFKERIDVGGHILIVYQYLIN